MIQDGTLQSTHITKDGEEKMKEELLAAKDRTLLTRIAETALNFLRGTPYVRAETPGTSNEEGGEGNGRPDFYTLGGETAVLVHFAGFEFGVAGKFPACEGSGRSPE
jgi:hypothetical protein